VLDGLYEQIKNGRELAPGDVEGAIRLAISQGSLFDYDSETPAQKFEELNLRKRPVRARTMAQDAYIRALKRNSLVFGAGPAGTGKTWLAVAYAIMLFERKEVDRIILSRPAVEAGERLGFLPGDVLAKVDPYMRPLFDALYDTMDPEKLNAFIERGTIEVAPLAFMRGRTLNDSFIILDEAQNTSPEQMQMFLTRLGFGSKVVVTGDITQIDLPREQASGLIQVQDILGSIDGIEFVRFGHEDVVRHKLVQRIVEAYKLHSEETGTERKK
jgi:phosphate starvation-inducible PhoH-like protein